MEFIILIALFGLMYVVLILPQQRKMRRHQEFVSQLQTGDEVMTSSGIYGTITDIEGDIIHLAIDTDVVVRVARGSIGKMDEEEQADERDDRDEIDLDDDSDEDEGLSSEEVDYSDMSNLSPSDDDSTD